MKEYHLKSIKEVIHKAIPTHDDLFSHIQASEHYMIVDMIVSSDGVCIYMCGDQLLKTINANKDDRDNILDVLATNSMNVAVENKSEEELKTYFANILNTTETKYSGDTSQIFLTYIKF